MYYAHSIKPISYLKTYSAQLLAHIAADRVPLVINHNGAARGVSQEKAFYEETFNCANRSGVPTSTHRPLYNDAVTKPSSMAQRSKGASGALTDCGLPAGMPHRASLKNDFLYSAMVLKV